MSHYLNYYQPYTANLQKENSLTRAFMSLVRLCPVVRQGFYEMVREQANATLGAGSDLRLLPYSELSNLSADIKIQEGELPISSQYLSVLLTNNPRDLEGAIQPVDRAAIYDGIFTIDGLTLFIENKPFDDITN